MPTQLCYRGRTLRAVFMGTPSFAVPSLARLAEVCEVPLVVTRPDAVRARGKQLVPSDVKAKALELGLPVFETRRIDESAMEALRAAQADIVVVAAYGAMLPDALLATDEAAPTSLGCVNVHASLLPRWRGAAPVQRAILEGDERAGVSIMALVHEMDAGAYCAQASAEVGEKSFDELLAELAELGADLLVSTLPAIADGTAEWVEQDLEQVTFAPKVTKLELCLSPEVAARVNLRRVQTSSDSAPARCAVGGKGVRVLEARKAEEVVDSGVYERRRARVLLGCVDGTLELLRVKPDGKREMEVSAWAAGLREKSGSWTGQKDV